MRAIRTFSQSKIKWVPNFEVIWGLLLGVVNDFGHKSMSRNPLLFSLFTRMHLVERIASGIPRMREAMKEANLPEPIFHTDGMFTVTFYRPQKDIKGIRQLNKTLSERQTRIVQMMNENDKVTYEEIIADLHLSPTTLNKDIKFLKELGVIERVGSARNGKWGVLLKV